MHFSTIISILALSTTSLAHPGEVHEDLTSRELHELKDRQLQARNCQPQIARYITEQKAKRAGMRKRAWDGAGGERVGRRADGCVLAPEVTEGPYYINDELVRSNLIEDLVGVNATIDIQVLDSSTCEPYTDALVELWNASPAGVYSGYSASTGTGGSAPAKRQGGGGSSALSSSQSFLRGGNVVDSNGNLTINTLYPGYYTGRTAHIHVMVHGNYSINANGTIASREGSLLHVGQMFFEEEYNYLVFNTTEYEDTGNTRTYNADDSILQADTTTGFSPYAQVELISDDILDGVFMYQVLVVDTSAAYSVTNGNFAPSFTYSSDYATTTTAGSGTNQAIANVTTTAAGTTTSAASSSLTTTSKASSTVSAAAASATTSTSGAGKKFGMPVIGEMVVAVVELVAGMRML